MITNIVVSQASLREHPNVFEAVLRGTVKTNEWINAHQDKAKASANTKLATDTGKPLDAEVIRPAQPSFAVTDDPAEQPGPCAKGRRSAFPPGRTDRLTAPRRPGTNAKAPFRRI